MTYKTVSELFTAICDAIRSKEETTEPISHQDIPTRIAGIKSGGLMQSFSDEVGSIDFKLFDSEEIEEGEEIT